MQVIDLRFFIQKHEFPRIITNQKQTKSKRTNYVWIDCFSDVFPYGIYMLSYEYARTALTNSQWTREKKKRIKEMENAEKKTTYFDASIPILAGAFAGTTLFI